MESSSEDDFVTLVCGSPDCEEGTETLISTNYIQTWNLASILRCRTVQIQAHRPRWLCEQSSYFRGLLGGTFSESKLECFLIEWNLEIFIYVLKCVYGCQVEVTSSNFLPLYEAALFFGVETLLGLCRAWFSKVFSLYSPGLHEIALEDLIHIWSCVIEHANDFVPELCVSFLARNFMWAMSTESFVHIPYKLLLWCIKHPHLTVYSEMHLSDALLVWLNANAEQLESLSRVEDSYTNILKEVRSCLLPLWFVAGKRRSHYFSEIANESIQTIFGLMDIQATGFPDVLRDGDLDHLRIRFTEYLQIVNLSGCPQLTSAILMLSLLPYSYFMDFTSIKNIKQDLTNILHLINHRSRISQVPPILSFEAVEELDISKCVKLNLETTIACISMSFPSLRKLKALHLLNFKSTTLHKLVQKCPLINEVDLTVDITPLLPGQVSVVSSDPTVTPAASNKSMDVANRSVYATLYCSGPSLSHITRLTLEGRSNVYDSDLQYIAKCCVCLNYVNLKGCVSVTDDGISNLICSSLKLDSIIVCYTSFGRNSVLALCSSIANFTTSNVAQLRDRHSDTLANKLETLHMGGCKGVDEISLLKLIAQSQALRSLCLRDTYLVDDVLYNFSGTLLEALDVSDTKISGAAMAHIVHGNPALRSINVKGCKNLIQQGRNDNRVEHPSSFACGDLYTGLGKTCLLEEIEVGWSFSCISLEALKPAIMSLRAVTVGLGGSLDENALRLLPLTCPMLKKIVLFFQVISDTVVIPMMTSLRYLRELALCYCLGDISMSSFKLSVPKLRRLRLERVTPWMTNNDLAILTENCANLIELSLLGCRLLNSDSLQIITCGWPGLLSLHLEECGEITANGVSSLYNCIALEDLLLRHNGQGICRSFILDAASKMPMLRKLSLDLCDACEDVFDIPDYADGNNSISCVKIARCKLHRISTKRLHKETLALVWNSERLIKTVVKERL